MYTNIDEMYHAAIKILENRADQLSDDELMHYGRKGMKWNQNIFAEDETAKRLHNTDPHANQASQALNRAKWDLAMKQQHESERAESQARTASESAARQRATDPRANQAAQALNRAKWDQAMSQKKTRDSIERQGVNWDDGREGMKRAMLEEKARRLAQNGRAEGAAAIDQGEAMRAVREGRVPQGYALTDSGYQETADGKSYNLPLRTRPAPGGAIIGSSDSKMGVRMQGNSNNQRDQKSEEPKYNGMTSREHLKTLNDNLNNAFPGGFDDYVNRSLTTAVDIDKAYGNKNDADDLKNEFRQTMADSINQYLSENNIPQSETSKFQALYDSYTGRYDDAVDAALGIGAYQPIFGNRKNKYR